jgi:hypothetical protein
LKEGLRTVFAIAHRDPGEAIEALDRWISCARRCRLPQFVTLSRSITRDRDAIIAAIINRLSNAPHRVDEHQDQTDHPPRIRLPFDSGHQESGWADTACNFLRLRSVTASASRV